MSEPTTPAPTVEARARATGGSSSNPVYRLATRTITGRHPGGGTLVDVGCGRGALWGHLRGHFDRYVGVDVVPYEGFPDDGTFCKVDLDAGRAELDDGVGDVVAAVETIEHVENPRAFVRELVRLTRPGGLVVVTTPNQLSLLSKLGLVLKNQFPAFQERPGLYPAHITALLAGDLVRIARECGLVDPAIRYTGSGRVPGTPWRWPGAPGGRAFSDNVLMEARRP